MKSLLKIATRSSPLAMVQVEEIIRELKTKGQKFAYETLTFEASGDKDKSTPLTESRDDFFTDAIDRALLEGKADIAVHSAKDLPQNFPGGLKIFAITKGLTNKDVWVGRFHWKNLPLRAKVGTSSILRQQQVLAMRPDITIVNIRGTIQERLELVKSGQVDGIVVAACALQRLKLETEIKDIFPWKGMPLQGQLAVVGRAQDHELEKIFRVIDARHKILLHCGTNPQLYGHLGRILHWPMISIKPIHFNEAQQKNLLQIFESADIIVFTSRHAVEFLFEELRLIKPAVNLKGKFYAVIGKTTQEALQKYNIEPAVISQEETAESLFKAMVRNLEIKDIIILLPRSSLPNPFLKEALAAQGGVVREIAVYENIKPSKRDLPAENITGVIFTSPSTVRNFLEDYGKIPDFWQILARGQVTLKSLKEAGYTYAESLS